MVDHPAARALTGYLLVRGGVHQVAYARAVENLTGANLMKLFPAPRTRPLCVRTGTENTSIWPAPIQELSCIQIAKPCRK